MRIEDFFVEVKSPISCHSGGAEGADTEFELGCVNMGIPVYAYSWKTERHKSPNKVEISLDDFREGSEKVKSAAKSIGRKGVERHINLLARNWAQVKYSMQVFAVSTIVTPGHTEPKGRVSTAKKEIVAGGTGYAVEMAILHEREVYVFDQVKCEWFVWSYSSERFVPSKEPLITKPFAGIGSRQLTLEGTEAIKSLLKRSFSSTK
jgi:hypothetical protein